MAAEHSHAFAWMSLHCFVKDVTDSFARKEREPFRVARTPIIPRSLSEWRYMREYHYVFGGLQRLWQDPPEMLCSFVPEFVKPLKTVFLRETGKFANQEKVVKTDGGVVVIPKACITPSIMTNKARRGVKIDRFTVSEPM